MQSPDWLSEAWKELGLAETPGASSNARILALFRDAHHPGIKSDETAWCAAFVGAVLERTGLKSTRSLMARSYLAWGEPASEPRLGAIAVFSRGSDPNKGHVGFVLSALPDAIVLLGGNQKDAVTVTRMPRANLLGLRWPSEAKSDVSGEGTFEIGLSHVLEMEGGFDEDPLDPGGPTNQGITLKEFADWNGEPLTSANRDAMKARLKAIDRKSVRAIYRKSYWVAARCEDLPPTLGRHAFRCRRQSWNGRGRAHASTGPWHGHGRRDRTPHACGSKSPRSSTSLGDIRRSAPRALSHTPPLLALWPRLAFTRRHDACPRPRAHSLATLRKRRPCHDDQC